MNSKIDKEDIYELEREISKLPNGNLTVKKIKGKNYFYYRENINGKRHEKYVDFKDVDDLKKSIDRRKELKRKLKIVLKGNINNDSNYNTIIRKGNLLREQVSISKKYKKRFCFDKIKEYIYKENQNKVLILYGLRRTGKTTLINQTISELNDEEFNKAVYIQVQSSNSLSDLNSDLQMIEEQGYKYVFIDEVSLLNDFIDGAAVFSDIYASSGMKIVLSGTDSLGFAIAKEEQLYDRSILIHTTFISYKEFEEVLGLKGIDEYIRFGGTMSLSGINYNDSIFSSLKSTNEYIDTAIAKNIQHSLKLYQSGGHFRKLFDLYENGELTNVINRVVENINHSFAKSVIERAFYSHDLHLSASNLLKDRNRPIDIKKHMDFDIVTNTIMKILDILNKEEQTIDIDNDHMSQIKEYLYLLDLIYDIDLVYLPKTGKGDKFTVIIQPGLRYAQVSAIFDAIMLDPSFKELPIEDRNNVLLRIKSEICGRMMEEIILYETKMANPRKEVFKVQFDIGEIDMVVYDPDTISCSLYEIKYSKETIKEQYQHLEDTKKCQFIEHEYGRISNKCVLYRGNNKEIDNIKYINVEKFLKGLS